MSKTTSPYRQQPPMNWDCSTIAIALVLGIAIGTVLTFMIILMWTH